MKYEMIKDYSDENFRRITGVKRKTFRKMFGLLQAALSVSLIAYARTGYMQAIKNSIKCSK